MRTIEDFKRQAVIRNITIWPVHNCSLCGYPCSFLIDLEKNTVQYDHGCDCVNYTNIRNSSWEEMLEIYEDFNPIAKISIDHLWGFN